MDVIKIEGGHPITGEVTVEGAKNSALKLMERLLDVEEMYALVIDPEEGCDTGTPAAWAATNARVALEGPQAAAFREALGTKGMSLLG